MNKWKSPGDRQIEYMADVARNSFFQLEDLQKIHIMLEKINDSLTRLTDILTRESISSTPSPIADEITKPAVGITQVDRKVGVNKGCCQTANGDPNKDRSDTYH